MEHFETVDILIWVGFFVTFVFLLWINRKLTEAEEEFQREVMQDER